MKKNIVLRILNRFLMRFGAISRISNNDKIVYLTFDDGPEPDITEFILSELKKYNFKATFFCKGINAEKHKDLVQNIINAGHAIGNHTYRHRHAYEVSTKNYIKDVEKADTILRTPLFRPPNGCIKVMSWLNLRKKYKLFYWSIASRDWQKEAFSLEKCKDELKKTESGDIILFHFAKEFETQTKISLSWYLEWLYNNGFTSQILR